MRRLTLALLLIACVWVFIRPTIAGDPPGFDPLDVRGREVERAIEERRFADALPIARELQSAHADDVVIAYWMGEIYHGLGRWPEEADAWTRVLDLTHEADAACPALPEAYAKAGEAARSIAEYERCASMAATDPERWIDLATAYERSGRPADAARALGKARELDPTRPRLRGSGHAPSPSGEGAS